MIGQDRAVEQFAAAWGSRKLHHAWLLAGPKGVGKSTFANAAARRVLADAAGPQSDSPGLGTDNSHPMVKLVEAGSHPDMRRVERKLNEKGVLNRSIKVDQIRELGEFMSLTPALSPWRVVVIDAADELENSGANALLKILEEPPSNSLFLLVSHAPGRLLPTIRSRCRRLDFATLEDDAMTSILATHVPDLSASERARLISMSFGSAGRAVAVAELGLDKIEDAAVLILRQGDPANGRRSDLALELGKKGAADRYAAFLELAPSLIAREARKLHGNSLERALDAYAKVRELAAIAPRLSLDPAATVFQIGSYLAEVAGPASLKR
jgi:DNA polymerase-3 subunit delta'